MLTQLKVGAERGLESGVDLYSSDMVLSPVLQSALSPCLSALVRSQVVWGGEVVDRSVLVVPQSSGRQKGVGSSVGGMESVDLYLKQVGLE